MWDKIKKLMQKSGSKFIIVENDQPAYVVLPIAEYENLLEGSQIEKANQEIIELRAAENQETKTEESLDEQTTDKDEDKIKVEDLPF